MSIHAVVKGKKKTRPGKGFSRAELKDMELNVNKALRQDIPIDIRRSTNYKENVKTLKTYTQERKLGYSVKEKKINIAEQKKVKKIDPKEVKKIIKAIEDARSHMR